MGYMQNSTHFSLPRCHPLPLVKTDSWDERRKAFRETLAFWALSQGGIAVDATKSSSPSPQLWAERQHQHLAREVPLPVHDLYPWLTSAKIYTTASKNTACVHWQ